MSAHSELLEAIGGPEFERALALGTARTPIEAPRALAERLREPGVDWRLAALALHGQSLRFRRPVVPAWSDSMALPRPDRPLLGERARRLLARLPNTSTSGVAGLAIGAALDVRGVALHPFDLHRIAGWIRGVPHHRLDTFTQAWLSRRNNRTNVLIATVVPDWETASLQERCAILREERVRDPDAGRVRIAQALAGETAAARARYVEVLGLNSSPADLPLLESLRADRSETVRESAAALLAAIAGTPEHAARLEEAFALVARKDGSAGPAFSIRVPAARRASTHGLGWALEAFAGVELEALAARFGLGRVEFARAARGDHALATVVAELAVRDGAVDPAPVLDALPDVAWGEILGDVSRADARERRARLAVVRPALWDELPRVHELEALVRACDGPSDARIAREICAGAALRAAIAASNAPDAPKSTTDLEAKLLALAALAPAGERALVIASIADVALAHKHGALQLLELLDAIENDEPSPIHP